MLSCNKENVNELITKIEQEYSKKCKGLKASCFVSVAGPGADVLTIS